MSEDTPNRLVVDFLPGTGGMKISTEGPGLTPDQLILAAHYLRRTADQFLDAQSMAAPPQPSLVKAAAIPDHMKRRD